MKLSPKELRMIEHFGYDDLVNHVEPLVLYRMMVEKAFLLNDQTPFAEALRRSWGAFCKGGVHRLTPEWEELLGDI